MDLDWWLANWFNLAQTIGIVASLLITVWMMRQGVRVRACK